MIAVLGAGGQVGSALMRRLGDAATPCNRQGLDLAHDVDIAPWVARNQPKLVINCAAYTAVDAAEREEAVVRQVNALAVGELARAIAEIGGTLVTFSTDYVFDGSKDNPYVESDPPNPINVYGATKLEGEHLALESNPATLVVRTSWVMSGTHRSFASTILDRLAAGTVSVVDDQRGRPTLADDLAAKVVEAVGAGARGVLHLTNQGETTWFGLAQEIAGIAGFDPDRVNPISSAEFLRPARRPANSVLDSERLAEWGLTPLPNYRLALEKAVAQLVGGGGRR